MGGLWWWIHADSPRQVLETFAEVEIVDSAEGFALAERWQLEEIDIDDLTLPPGLAEARAQRDRQRGLPGFGALAGRQVVYLRRPWDEDDPAIYLMELGSDGRRIRQIEVAEDGTAIKTDDQDWPFNPPYDLFDPELPQFEIDSDEFERAWTAAQWDKDHQTASPVD